MAKKSNHKSDIFLFRDQKTGNFEEEDGPKSPVEKKETGHAGHGLLDGLADIDMFLGMFGSPQ